MAGEPLGAAPIAGAAQPPSRPPSAIEQRTTRIAGHARTARATRP